MIRPNDFANLARQFWADSWAAAEGGVRQTAGNLLLYPTNV